MLSYRYMAMQMEGMRMGTDPLSDAEVLEDFNVTPIEMPINMHMVGIMYAVPDNLTLKGMISFFDNGMDHLTRMGGNFTTSSGGFGDLRVSGLYKIVDNNKKRIHLNLTVSIPKGSIDEMDVTPASAPAETQLPYPMQIGTGTIDIMLGITYLAQGSKSSFGAQAISIFRLGNNDRNYNR